MINICRGGECVCVRASERVTTLARTCNPDPERLRVRFTFVELKLLSLPFEKLPATETFQ